uniref:Uncharacterized protein n=1 Tax=Panagrolaimus sp. PS1159 TaxID=55785 RepID=A0AC35FS95_9BILA
MLECNFADVYESAQPDDFFRLSSRLYNTVDHLTIDDRMRLLPVLEDLVSKFENCFMIKSLIRSIRRFIDDEILPYKHLSYAELPYKAGLQSDGEEEDDDAEFLNDDDFLGDEFLNDDDACSSHEELFIPLRKGSPLRFDGLSIVSEEAGEDGGTTYGSIPVS